MTWSKNLTTQIIEQTTDHDTECAMKAGQLIDLGFMGEEFACYGVAYTEDKKIKYFVCEQEQTILHFLQRLNWKNLLPTSVIYEVKRFQVPVGKNDFFKNEIRETTARRLKELYGVAFFKAMNICQNIDGQDFVWPALHQISKELRNSFDIHIVQIVEGVAEDAYQMKQLNQEHYTVIEKWAERERMIIADDEKGHGKYQRYYYGFCSSGVDGLSYYANASLYETRKKRHSEIGRGKMVSPIIYRLYSDDSYLELIEYKKDFLILLKNYFTVACMDSLATIWKLPPSIDLSIYQQCLTMVQAERKSAAIKDFLYYGNIWNMIR